MNAIQNKASMSKVQDINSTLDRCLDRHVECEAADACAFARLGETQVCELHDPHARIRTLHARHGEAREVEQHARRLILRGATDYLFIFTRGLVEAHDVS